jgi:hypothetical protein
VKVNWNSLAVCVLLAACGIVALVLKNDLAAVCVGALVGVLTPTPYER